MSAEWGTDPATERQKAKLRFFGCTWDEGITKAQASDALDQCVSQFPEIEAAYQNRPAAEEQLQALEARGKDIPPNLTYRGAKELLESGEEVSLNEAVAPPPVPPPVLSDPTSAENLLSCPCNHCSVAIEYPPELVDQNATCPHCGLETLLFQPHTGELVPSTRSTGNGVFGWISNKLEQRKQRKAHEEAERLRIEAERARKRQEWIDGIIANLRNGITENFENLGIVLQKGEKVLWVEPGVLHEIRVVSRRYEGGSAGVRFRVAKGVSFNVGKHRGQLVSETGVVPVSDGNLVITNQRLIFSGDRKSFAIKLAKILEKETRLNALAFTENGKDKPKMVKYHNDKNGDIVCGVLNFALAG
ncbi:MAG: hypothetical protein HY043_02730 [Verrucomicrobia bacterium]|nr:hypothetical protein [Verrucomicrobiota bacterium]